MRFLLKYAGRLASSSLDKPGCSAESVASAMRKSEIVVWQNDKYHNYLSHGQKINLKSVEHDQMGVPYARSYFISCCKWNFIYLQSIQSFFQFSFTNYLHGDSVLKYHLIKSKNNVTTPFLHTLTHR